MEESQTEREFLEQHKLLESVALDFLSGHTEWEIDSIFERYRELVVEQLEREAEPQIPTYLPCTIIPPVLMFVSRFLNSNLPKGFRLHPDDENLFITSLLKALNPTRFPPVGYVYVYKPEDLLDPSLDHQWDRTLDDETVAALQDKARATLISDSDVPPAVAQRASEILAGHFPCGFNTTEETRWVLADRRWILYPIEDVVHEMDEGEVRYLNRSALELMEKLDKSEELPEEVRAAQQDYLQAIVDGTYPHSYRKREKE